jgi:hypothetical protein
MKVQMTVEGESIKECITNLRALAETLEKQTVAGKTAAAPKAKKETAPEPEPEDTETEMKLEEPEDTELDLVIDLVIDDEETAPVKEKAKKDTVITAKMLNDAARKMGADAKKGGMAKVKELFKKYKIKAIAELDEKYYKGMLKDLSV